MNLFKREVRKYILVNDSRQIGKQVLNLTFIRIRQRLVFIEIRSD
jgi:hypothetical protein